MSSKYTINNLSIEIISVPLQINIHFLLNEQQRIDLRCLISGIISIEFDAHFPASRLTEPIMDYVSSFSKRLATEIHVDINDRQGSVTPLSYTFAGGLGNQQMVELITDVAHFLSPDSVLVFAFDSRISPRLLLVKHRKRGWELPGGKLETNENEVDAAVRETREEGAVELIPESIRAIAQYRFYHDGEGKVHIRTVFLALIHSHLNAALDSDTMEKRITVAPTWDEADIFNPNNQYSPYLKDNVYPICLELALTKLSAHY